MDRDDVYEYIEEADRREVMELLEAVVNRFRELHKNYDLVVMSLPLDETREEQLSRVIDMLREKNEWKPRTGRCGKDK